MTSSDYSPDQGLTLILNGAEERLQIVLGQQGENELELLTSQEWSVMGQTAKYLAPALDSALHLLGKKATDINRVACVTGPGSFTGLRIALATGAGIAAGNRATCAGLAYLPLLAQSAAGIGHGLLHIITHSRMRQVYHQAFDALTAAPASKPIAATLEEAAEVISALPGPGMLLGSGLRRNPDFFRELADQNDTLTTFERKWENPRPEILIRAADVAEYGHEPIGATYLRASDAEDNLDSIAQARGLEPNEAREMLRKAEEQLL